MDAGGGFSPILVGIVLSTICAVVYFVWKSLGSQNSATKSPAASNSTPTTFKKEEQARKNDGPKKEEKEEAKRETVCPLFSFLFTQ